MKYSIAFIFAIFISVCVYAQTTFEIVFDDSKSAAKIDKVDMFDVSQKEIYSSTFKKNVKFFFKKKQIDAYWIIFSSGEKIIRKQLWLNPGKIKIIAHADSLKFIIDTIYNAPFFYKEGKIQNNINSFLTVKDTASLNKFLLKTYKENIQNPYSLILAKRYLNINQLNKKAIQPLKKIFDTESGHLFWFTSYSEVKETIDKLVIANFVSLYDFECVDIDGQIAKIKFKETDYIVLDFWFLLCPPCLRDHEKMHEKEEFLKKKKVEIIGLSIDNEVVPWQKYVTSKNYTWQNYLIGKESKIYEQLKVGACPYYVILDKKGEIKATYPIFSDVLAYFDIKSN